MIKAIFACDVWGGMGYKGGLPWPSHSEDLQYFKSQTLGGIVVMGRRTWDDPKFPKPLPGRINYVATTRPLFGYNVTTIRGDIADRLKKIEQDHPNQTIWIIGGPKLLMETRSLVDEVHITHFKGQYRTDTQIDLRNYLSVFQTKSAATSSDRKCSWLVYKNIDIFKSK